MSDLGENRNNRLFQMVSWNHSPKVNNKWAGNNCGENQRMQKISKKQFHF